MAEKFLRVYAFIDGAQLRAGLQELGAKWEEVNLLDIAKVGLRGVGSKWQGLDMVVSRVFVYDAVGDNTATKEEQAVERWLRRNGQQPDVHVRRGGLAGDPKKPRARRQKAVDVQLAVDAVTWASNGVFDVALLVTGDGDFAPVAEAVRDRGPLVALFCFESRLSPVLREAADRVGYLLTDPAAYDGWALPKDE